MDVKVGGAPGRESSHPTLCEVSRLSPPRDSAPLRPIPLTILQGNRTAFNRKLSLPPPRFSLDRVHQVHLLRSFACTSKHLYILRYEGSLREALPQEATEHTTFKPLAGSDPACGLVEQRGALGKLRKYDHGHNSHTVGDSEICTYCSLIERFCCSKPRRCHAETCAPCALWNTGHTACLWCCQVEMRPRLGAQCLTLGIFGCVGSGFGGGRPSGRSSPGPADQART